MAPPNADDGHGDDTLDADPSFDDALLDDEEQDAEGADDAPLARRQPRRRWLAMLVAVGALIAGSPLLEELTDQRDVIIRLDEPQRVTSIAVNLRAGDEVLWGTERHFASGKAPQQLTRSLPLSPGRYQVSLDVTVDGRSRHLERELQVAEDATQIIIPVR